MQYKLTTSNKELLQKASEVLFAIGSFYVSKEQTSSIDKIEKWISGETPIDIKSLKTIYADIRYTEMKLEFKELIKAVALHEISKGMLSFVERIKMQRFFMKDSSQQI